MLSIVLEPDSRAGLGYNGPTGIGSRDNINETGGAFVGNLTITDTGGPGIVQVGPRASMVDGATSSINASAAEQTAANSLIVPVNGGLGIYTSDITDVVMD